MPNYIIQNNFSKFKQYILSYWNGNRIPKSRYTFNQQGPPKKEIHIARFKMILFLFVILSSILLASLSFISPIYLIGAWALILSLASLDVVDNRGMFDIQ